MAKRNKFALARALIVEYLRLYKKELILLSFFGVSQAVFDAAIPFIMGGFLDAILDIGKTLTLLNITAPLWLWFVVAFAVAQAFASYLGWLHGTKGRILGTNIHASYMARSAGKVMKLPMSFHRDKKTGEVWDRISRSSSALMVIIERVLVMISPQLLSVVVGLIIALHINVTLSLIIVGGIFLYILTLVRIVPPLVSLQKIGHRAWNRAFDRAFRGISNVQTVKSSTAEDYENKAVERKYIKGVIPKWNKVEGIWANIAAFQRVLVVITQVTVFVVSVYFISKGDLTVGGLVAFNGYSAMVFSPFMRLGYSWESIQNGLVAINRAEEFIKEPSEIFEPVGAKTLKDIKGNIEFKNVRFKYSDKDKNVLRGISFSIKPGDRVALVGESGVGKTTIAELISAYNFPDRGEILIDGVDTRMAKLRELREAIAVVPQEVSLFNDTIEFNLKYGNLKSTKKQIVEAAKEAYAHEFIQKFPKKYKQLVGERGVKLSVGQKQRVAIARAILRDPKILILDEPTSALDIQTEKQITDSLEKLMEGRTTIIIAHRLSTVRKADKILVFDKGNLVEQGKHKDLIKKKNGLYSKLYKLHIGLD